MPPKEVLVAKVLGGLNAPISGFANVLSANLRGLVVALNAIAEKTERLTAPVITKPFHKNWRNRTCLIKF